MYAPGEVVSIGDVAMHDDGQEHMAVILANVGEECEALFFTSQPNWAARTRRATREELAMAGFVHSRVTYLAHVQRPSWEFKPLGRSFPLHWVEALRSEFGVVTKVTQTESE